jgi:hypothetical protein
VGSGTGADVATMRVDREPAESHSEMDSNMMECFDLARFCFEDA